MAGHNKWSKIKRKKGVNDQKRGALFSKLVKEITIAAKQGGGDPAGNPRLRSAIEEGKSEGLPKDNIERAIKKGTGELGDGVQLDELIYEGFAPHGVAVLVDCITDNKLRTQPEIRKLFEKGGGQIAEKGAVSWNFDTKGQVLVSKEDADEDKLVDLVLDAGAEDITTSEDGYEIITSPQGLESVRSKLEKAKIKMLQAKVAHLPKTKVDVAKSDAEAVQNLIDMLEDHDDVQEVSINAEL